MRDTYKLETKKWTDSQNNNEVVLNGHVKPRWEGSDYCREISDEAGKPRSENTVRNQSLKSDVDYINVGHEDQMEIYGYRVNQMKRAVTWCLLAQTLFIVRLIFHWKPEWMLYCTHERCPLAVADTILLIDEYGQMFLERVQIMTKGDIREEKSEVIGETILKDMNELKMLFPVPRGQFVETDSIRFFENKKIRYLWFVATEDFQRLNGFDDVSCSYFYQQKGLPIQEQSRRRLIYGNNNIKVAVQTTIQLLFAEILNPFYVFQVLSVLLWFFNDYYYYATCIVIMSTFSIVTAIRQTQKNQRDLRDTIQSSDTVTVWRGKDEYESVSSEDLVPGDVICIPSHGCMMHCDAVLVSGNCIVNESMLTGESVPVTKTPIPKPGSKSVSDNNQFALKEHARHVLFSGTKVIQTRYYGSEKVKAVVIKTGFLTSKGDLVRSIMFPKPVDFKFHRDSLKFIGVLFIIACFGFVYTVVQKVMSHQSAKTILFKALDLITIVVPPALPAAMTVGIAYAQSRLKDARIYCISPRTINMSGCINCVCFDKTGTLTEDGLDMWGVASVSSKRFDIPTRDLLQFPKEHPMIVGMATCHSLTIIDKQLSGDPLDLKMFESTGWVLEEPEIEDSSKYDIITPTIVHPASSVLQSDSKSSAENMELMSDFQVGIVRQFTFSSGIQRMSVITRVLGAQHFDLYTKGSPEVIVSLSNPDTIPENFAEVLHQYTQQGYRVLALATKPLPKLNYVKVQRVARETLETGLTFLGLLVMENRLKPESTPTIEVLKKANIRTIMVTGDNMLTALSVARDCKIIKPGHKVIRVEATRTSNQAGVRFHYADDGRPADLEMESYMMTPHEMEKGERSSSSSFHFALSGKSFAVLREFFPDVMPKIAVRGTVFGRMSPEQKQQLVEQLQDLGYYVAMCGDGANDCGALKAAHAGISLSESEASVASPFTSKDQNISCVPTLIREGRAALVTSFGIFKYMACYSLTQFVSVIILYSIHSNLTDLEFLYIDLFLITVFAALFGGTHAYPVLDKSPPPSSLIGLTPLSSVATQMVINIAAQVLVFLLVRSEPWFVPFVPKNEDDLKCSENYAVFSVSLFQYITLVLVFSQGPPYRKSFYTNRLYTASLIVMTLVSFYIILYPFDWLKNELQLAMPPEWKFRFIIMAVAVANLFLCFLAERFLVGVIIFRFIQGGCKTFQKNPWYMNVESELQKTPDWPPVTMESAPPEYVTHTPSPNANGDVVAHGTGTDLANESSSESDSDPETPKEKRRQQQPISNGHVVQLENETKTPSPSIINNNSFKYNNSTSSPVRSPTASSGGGSSPSHQIEQTSTVSMTTPKL